MSANTIGHVYPNLKGLRVGIIGAGGVGKAHAIAALKRQATLAVIVDTNRDVLDLYFDKPRITNTWGTFTEYAQLTSDPKLFLTVESARAALVDCDLIVIATPNGHHQFALETCYDPRIKYIVEKPYCCTVAYDNVYMSSEWLYSSLVQELKRVSAVPTVIKFWHNNADTYHGLKPLVLDLFPHVLSIAHYLGVLEEVVSYKQMFTRSTTNPKEFSALTVATDVKGLTYSVAYNPLWDGTVFSQLFGPLSFNDWLNPGPYYKEVCEHCELMVGSNVGTNYVPWEDNLFALQLDQVVQGKGLSSATALTIDKIMRTI